VAARAGGAAGLTPEELGRQMELADFRKMNQIRARVDATIEDPKTAEALKPWYRQFCKRPTFNDDYLPTFNRPNVTLVDTKGHGVERVTEKGVVAGGVEYEVDCIIFATGFEVGTAYTRRAGFEIVGREGRTLSDYWRDGMKTLHGFSSHGFPNCFHLGITQNTLTPNFPHMLDEQARHVAHVVHEADLRQAKSVEPSAEAETAWRQTIRDNALNNLKFRQDCTPGYYNGEGHAGEGMGLFDGLYGPGSDAFFALLRQWRDDGQLAGLEVR
jgi:cyclohexanone monooxygenase